MKININRAVGYIKQYFILILQEEDSSKRAMLSDTLHHKILKEIVPIREGRNNARIKSSSNQYRITKRKAF